MAAVVAVSADVDAWFEGSPGDSAAPGWQLRRRRRALTPLDVAGFRTSVFAAAKSPLVERLAHLVETISTDLRVHTDLATYRRWAAEVARFGFETYDLYTGRFTAVS